MAGLGPPLNQPLPLKLHGPSMDRDGSPKENWGVVSTRREGMLGMQKSIDAHNVLPKLYYLCYMLCHMVVSNTTVNEIEAERMERSLRRKTTRTLKGRVCRHSFPLLPR